jgi:hypothetical protein
MSTTPLKNENSEITLNGLSNQGAVLQWLFSYEHTLNATQQLVYMYLVRQTAGYQRSLSGVLPYAKIAKDTKLGIRTVQTCVLTLIEAGFILKVGTNHIANSGKVAYKYRLNFRITKNFPFLNFDREDVAVGGKTKVPSKQKKLDNKQIVQSLMAAEDTFKAIKTKYRSTDAEYIAAKEDLDAKQKLYEELT